MFQHHHPSHNVFWVSEIWVSEMTFSALFEHIFERLLAKLSCKASPLTSKIVWRWTSKKSRAHWGTLRLNGLTNIVGAVHVTGQMKHY